jgi:hypothetical protein
MGTFLPLSSLLPTLFHISQYSLNPLRQSCAITAWRKITGRA